MEHILLFTTLPTTVYILIGLVALLFLFGIYALRNLGFRGNMNKFCRFFGANKNHPQGFEKVAPEILKHDFLKAFPKYKNITTDIFIKNMRSFVEYRNDMTEEFEDGYFLVSKKYPFGWYIGCPNHIPLKDYKKHIKKEEQKKEKLLKAIMKERGF